ncbi:hypothetical protein GCM10010195_75450 [Kitasatospora griseola]|nr:hypothetical protein GCM10010195_75450 [Kitasatospora griseola]
MPDSVRVLDMAGVELLVWDYSGFMDKARLYFSRAAQHPQAEDDAVALFLLLNLNL